MDTHCTATAGPGAIRKGCCYRYHSPLRDGEHSEWALYLKLCGGIGRGEKGLRCASHRRLGLSAGRGGRYTPEPATRGVGSIHTANVVVGRLTRRRVGWRVIARSELSEPKTTIKIPAAGSHIGRPLAGACLRSKIRGIRQAKARHRISMLVAVAVKPF